MQKRYGVSLDRNWISRALRRIGYSQKLISHRSWHKYTPENLKDYVDFLADVRSIPLGRIKFLDEAHFNSKGIISLSWTRLTCLLPLTDVASRRGWSRRGRRCIVVDDVPADFAVCMVAMTTLSDVIQCTGV
jgi:hypothetical protein